MADKKYEDIIMAGWFPVKKIILDNFTYEAGGFTTPYNVIAVLAVNSPGMTGCVYKDTSGAKPVQKIKLSSGTTEASGSITTEVFVLTQL